MAKLTLRTAINTTLKYEMRRDPKVILLGEDIAGGRGGSADVVEAGGGVFGITSGLAKEFGHKRVIDTPITESAIIGAAAGSALTGMRPVAELMFIDFIGVCLDQIMNQIAKFRYMFGGSVNTPLTIRTMIGAGMGAGPQHSGALYPMLASIPGLKVVLPSNAYDAKGLLAASIRDDDPVIFCEHKAMYNDACEVPDDDYTLPFGKANIVKGGDQVTIVAFSRMVTFASRVAGKMEKEGISVEVIDPRTISPLDKDTILNSVRKTGRLIVVDEANPVCGMASEVASIVSGEAVDCLHAPIIKLTAPHTPVPASPVLEKEYVPSGEKIEAAVKKIINNDYMKSTGTC